MVRHEHAIRFSPNSGATSAPVGVYVRTVSAVFEAIAAMRASLAADIAH